MKVIMAFIVTILLTSACPAGDKVIFESAIGFGSRYMPYSSKWEGAVKSGALEYREFAARDYVNLYSMLIGIRTTF